MTQELHGNDLQMFVSDEVKRIAKHLWADSVFHAGGGKLCAEVVDHGRGIVVSTFVGRSIVLPAKQFMHGDSPKYRRVTDRLPESVRQLLADILRDMEPQVVDAIRRSS